MRQFQVPRPWSLPPWRRVASKVVNRAWQHACALGAVGPQDELAKRFGAFGIGSCLGFPPGSVFGERWIHVGEATMIGAFVTLSAGMVPGQEMVTDPVVRIGNRCTIGRGSHIVGHLAIEIEDDVMTGPYVYITDQNHGYTDTELPIGTQMPNERAVRIGAGSWLGAGAVVLPGSDIGEHVVVAAGAVVLGEVPPRTVVAGVPARVVRRHDPLQGWVSPDPVLSGTRPASPRTGDGPSHNGR
ncbi:MAG: acyltransferase [Actinobacteria bacterium]|nr:acyltransferase [Actinomycetota bacterium]